jgi:hypothetical protein
MAVCHPVPDRNRATPLKPTLPVDGFCLSTPSVAADRDHAALQLGFYLASWGMLRASGFLLQYAYTIHLGVIDQLVAPQFSVLLGAFYAIREAYRPVVPQRSASDILVTKVLLGTFGCLPACDTYFKIGFKRAGFPYSSVNAHFLQRLLHFATDNLGALREEQRRIQTTSGICYPLMKLVDMYFWQIGGEK